MTGTTIGRDLNGNYDLELFTGGTPDPNGIYVIADSGLTRHAVIADVDDPAHGYRGRFLVKENTVFDANNKVDGIWATFNLRLDSDNKYRIESNEVPGEVMAVAPPMVSRSASSYWVELSDNGMFRYRGEIYGNDFMVFGSGAITDYSTFHFVVFPETDKAFIYKLIHV